MTIEEKQKAEIEFFKESYPAKSGSKNVSINMKILTQTMTSPEPSNSIEAEVAVKGENFIKEAFVADIARIDFNKILQETDIDVATQSFTNKFNAILDSHAPVKTFKNRKHYVPYITDDIKVLMSQHVGKLSKLFASTNGKGENVTVRTKDQLHYYQLYLKLWRNVYTINW